ncbi:MAG: hypothetical protein ISS31_09960 [Kiritimatiellae bacterium]|nr:hypothetical protein [Kiritimatiellia bacterium]
MRKLSGFSLNVPLLLAVVLCGCSKPKQEVASESGLTPHLSFSNTAEVVTETEVDAIREAGRVEADLNLDGHPDLVLMRTNDDDTGEVEVFLRKPPPAPTDGVAPMVQENEYVRVGTIQCKAGARIVGIASRTRDGFTDLIVLVGRAGQQPKMVHYLNDGTGFTEQ